MIEIELVKTIKIIFMGYVIFVDIIGLWCIIIMMIDLFNLIKRRLRNVDE